MPAPILFLEVDPQDRPMVTGQFPDAEVRSEAFSGAELIEACKGKEAVCCFIYSRFTADVINALPDLKLLCTRSVGYNHIDIAACRKRGIIVCNVPDYGSHVIAEHVFALLLSALRHVTEGDSKVESGNFDYRGLRGMALMGKTIGIVGTGKIGFCVAKIAHGFGMRILAVDKCRIVELETVYGVKYVDLDTLYKESDIVTLHVPALPDTIHMIDATAIGKMRSGVIIVNTARGELIDSLSLLQALESGKVARALLDVLEHEQNFQLNEKLIKHNNVIVTPHIAFYADDSTTRMFLESLYSIHQWQWKEKITHEVKPPTVVCDLPGVKK